MAVPPLAAALIQGFGWRTTDVVLGIAVVPAVLIDLFGADSLGTTLGVFFTATGPAALIGSTLAGIAVTESDAYQGVVVFALTVGLLGFIAILLVRSRLFGARRSDRR